MVRHRYPRNRFVMLGAAVLSLLAAGFALWRWTATTARADPEPPLADLFGEAPSIPGWTVEVYRETPMEGPRPSLDAPPIFTGFKDSTKFNWRYWGPSPSWDFVDVYLSAYRFPDSQSAEQAARRIRELRQGEIARMGSEGKWFPMPEDLKGEFPPGLPGFFIERLAIGEGPLPLKYWYIIRYGIPEEEAERLGLFTELAKELKIPEEAIPRASLFATEIKGVIQQGRTVVEIHAHANRMAEEVLTRILGIVFDRLHLEAVPLQALQDRPPTSPAGP